MEQHKSDLIIDQNYIPSMEQDNHILYFNKALSFAQTNYADEMDRMSKTDFHNISSQYFFREFCWCIYTSGFNAKIVSKFFDNVMNVYKDLTIWATSTTKYDLRIDFDKITTEALKFCNNKRKVAAIIKMAHILRQGISQFTWNGYRDNYLSSPEKLQALPFIGPITCFHLARNIGILECVKPDLHLQRMSDHWGFESPRVLCENIQKNFKLPLGIIDLCLWYSASTFGTKIKTADI